MQRYKVLVIPGRISGGVGTVVMNIFRNTDKNKVEFDFCVSESDPKLFNKEIEEAGGKVYYVPQIKKVGPVRYIRIMTRIISGGGPYDAVHIHSIHMGALALIASKMVGIKKRIYHVHSTQDAALMNLPFHTLLEMILNLLIIALSTHRLACGKAAGDYIYGRYEYTVINNAIDLNRFRPYSVEERTEIKKSLGLPKDKIIVGNVAQFTEGKNQRFFLDFAEKVKYDQNDIVVVLVGDGKLKNELEKETKDRGLDKIIYFLGNRSDIERIYNTMDVFCLPSLFEGLPVTALEAQATGIPCLLSDCITEEADLGVSSFIRVALSEPIEVWIRMVRNSCFHKNMNPITVKNLVSKRGFDLKSVCKEVEKIYIDESNGMSPT